MLKASLKANENHKLSPVTNHLGIKHIVFFPLAPHNIAPHAAETTLELRIERWCQNNAYCLMSQHIQLPFRQC